MAAEPLVFALDIGTRTIVGLVLTADAHGYRIKAAQIEEHETRSMFQGQIHDIEAVAGVVRRVKEKLEKRTGQKLEQVAVAAAGRSLITRRGASFHQPPPGQPVTEAQVKVLELEAVRQAQSELASCGQDDTQGYLCVGYSVFHYYLEGAPIVNLVGQRGQEIGVEVIATFLPQVVVDSLLSVLERAGLEVLTLTLEPIAALNVALPPGMRNLNLALVDIGAGTSDIALSRKGTIFAYAMIPRAGDEITESLCSAYLLDFPGGERLKRRLGEEEVKFTDILGNTVCLPAAEVKATLKPTVTKLARSIAEAILELNQGPPDGVVLVGGGSLTPSLPQKLAGALGLSTGRVGIRTRESLAGIKGQPRKLTGPEAVTPIGIGVWAFTGHPFTYHRVFVNGNPIHLWNLEGATVADALLASDCQWERLHPRPGLALTVEINGQIKSIKGELGEPARILVNGKEAALDAPLRDGDRLEFYPPRDGRDATACVGDLLTGQELTVQVNGLPTPLPPLVFLNGREVNDPSTPVPDRARLEIIHRQPLKRLLMRQGLAGEELTGQVYSYTLNGEKKVINWPRYHLTVNGHPAAPETQVEPGDTITSQKATPVPTLQDILGNPEGSLHFTLNNKPFHLTRNISVTVNGAPASPTTPVPANAVIKFYRPKETLLADIFTAFDPRSQGEGNRLVMKVNGEPADFTTPLKAGDKVDIYWEDNTA
jgi:cell division protein FtsA